MIANRNFAASTILACTASQIHRKMGKEVVNDWTALDAGVTPAIHTEIYEETQITTYITLLFLRE